MKSPTWPHVMQKAETAGEVCWCSSSSMASQNVYLVIGSKDMSRSECNH